MAGRTWKSDTRKCEELRCKTRSWRTLSERIYTKEKLREKWNDWCKELKIQFFCDKTPCRFVNIYRCWAVQIFLASIEPKEGGSKTLRNVDNFLQIDTSPYPRSSLSSSPLWEIQISKVLDGCWWIYLSSLANSMRKGSGKSWNLFVEDNAQWGVRTLKTEWVINWKYSHHENKFRSEGKIIKCITRIL